MESTVHDYGYLKNKKKTMWGMSTCYISILKKGLKTMKVQSYVPCVQNSLHFVILLSVSLTEIQMDSLWLKNL